MSGKIKTGIELRHEFGRDTDLDDESVNDIKLAETLKDELIAMGLPVIDILRCEDLIEAEYARGRLKSLRKALKKASEVEADVETEEASQK